MIKRAFLIFATTGHRIVATGSICHVLLLGHRIIGLGVIPLAIGLDLLESLLIFLFEILRRMISGFGP